MKTKFVLLLWCVVLLGASAFAVDGTVLINQNTAVNGLPGCGSTGFPIKICQSGSYKLAGNLVVSGNSHAIEIDSDYVSLDLNGFSITGPNICQTFPTLSCSGTSTGAGVYSWEHFGVTVRNGIIRGMRAGIESVYGAMLVEEVQAVGNSYGGIYADGAVIRRNIAINNGVDGIGCVQGGCVITDNVASNNGHKGLTAFDASVTGNVANRNGEAGIYAGTSVLNGNTFNFNPVAIENNGDLVSLSNNHCSGGPCQ